MAKCHNCYICVTNHHRQPSKHTVRTAITYGIALNTSGTCIGKNFKLSLSLYKQRLSLYKPRLRFYKLSLSLQFS